MSRVKAESYLTLLNTYNRDRSTNKKVRCECGKIVHESRLSKHKESIMHKNLLYKLEIYNQYKIDRINFIKLEMQKLSDELNELYLKNTINTIQTPESNGNAQIA